MAPPFSSPQGNAPQTLAALWCLVALALVFVLLRLYTRYKVIDAIGIDDHLFNVAFVLLVAYCVLITVSAFYGFGLIRDDVPDPWDRSMVIILTNAGQTVVGVAVWISKTALAFFLLRIFGACGRKTRWTIILPPVLLGLFVTAGLLAFWLECRPISYLWDRLNPDGVCGDTAVYLNLIAAILSFLCDFIFAALPWFTLRKIQMPPREKNIVLYSLSLGIFAGACGIMRAVKLPTMSDGEYMRDRATLIIWHAAELTVTMVAIGIPVCRPLWKGWVNRLLPGGDQDQIYSASYFSGEQRTIGGSEMWPSKEGDSKSRSKSRKGSKGHKSRPSDMNIHTDDIEMLDARDAREKDPTSGGHTPDSWSSWSRA
ncbi:hypothetical protein INS49_004636 [Diaporthe citri]|uniref:uncharacterized protein n=1 Tax=Diaporthe citri TaxID=83186 RepID=UPI001C807A8E|nr:uncharacterized protein INS49_004636 [Diaporthe citri]KAG6354618.1 hypothetical protein INS49_004636 [Diaporthe citri]